MEIMTTALLLVSDVMSEHQLANHSEFEVLI